MRLTELTIRTFRTERPQQTFFDDVVRGLGVRCTKGGTKTYVLMHGTDRKLTTIGRVETIGLKDARDRARVLLTKKDETTVTFGEAKDTFLTMHVGPNNRPSTAASTELRLRHFAALNDRPLASLKTGDLTAITDALLTAGKPSEANHAFVAVKTMLRFCVGRGYLDRDPLGPLRKPVEPRSRDRWLTAEEIVKLASWRPTAPYRALLMALLYTAQRLGQIQSFNPAWIEGERANLVVRFPASIMKGKVEHLLPVTPTIAELLRSLTPYRNLSDMHRVMLKETGIPHFTRSYRQILVMA